MAFEQNTRTLLATFNDYGTARNAALELENSGIPSEAIHVDSTRKTAGAGSGGGYETEREHEGGFTGWWHSLFGSDQENEERQQYEGALASGTAILRATVPTQSLDAAVDILNRAGAVDVDRRSGTEKTARTENSGRPIEVVEEELQVGKRAVRRGGVRIYNHVVTEPVEQQVRLREEHVNVERRPVDREISPADVSALRDQTIEVTEMAEEPVVGKRARVREEVVVGKEATERTETVRDNVRRTEVEVEQLGRETEASGTTERTGRAERKASPQTGTGSTRGSSMVNSPAPGVMSGSGTTPGTGTLAGEATAGSALQDFTPEYRRNFEQTYGSNSSFEAMRPAYEYGYTSANDTRYRGTTWDQAENDLRSDYETRYPGSRWEQAKDAVRYGWDKVTGRAQR
jgi:uncharacterized protein (TIGR02271 family)